MRGWKGERRKGGGEKEREKRKEKKTNQRTIRGPGEVQEGSFRAEKILKEASNDNFEESAINDLNESS